jgi:RHH-type rel operon transcriptional repressor/antitoxin RelB
VSYLYDNRWVVIELLSVRVPEEVEARLTLLAKNTGRSKSFYAREALLAHIDDLEDIYLGEKRLEDLRSGKDTSHPLAELAAEYGL